MWIDLTKTYTQWINLDEKTENAKAMESLLGECGIENHERFSAIRKEADHPTIKGEEHYLGVAASHFACMQKALDNGMPGLILEDDIEVSHRYKKKFEVPDDADAVYLGISHGDNNYEAHETPCQGVYRIKRMLAAHAIVYLKKRYVETILQEVPKFMNESKRPFDVGLYGLQEHFNIYAFSDPFFYQSNNLNGLNKWEELTRIPLRVIKMKPTVDPLWEHLQ